jgi:hypothetical protein
MSSTDRTRQEARIGARRATGLPGLTAALALSGRVLQPAGRVAPGTYSLVKPPAPTCNGDCPPPYHFPDVTCDPAAVAACQAQFRPEVEACFKAAEPYCADPQSAICQQMLDACAGIYGRFCPKYVPCSPFESCCAGNNEICANTPPQGSCPKPGCNWCTLGLNWCPQVLTDPNQCNSIPHNPWLPLGDSLFINPYPDCQNVQLVPNNVPLSGIIPPGSVLEVALTTNTAGLVTNASFTLTINGKPSTASYSFPSYQQYGFPAVVPVVVGSPGNQATFSSGSGELSYSVSSGELCVQPVQRSAGSVCGATWFGWTFENSNAVYGGVSPCCGSELSQAVWIE